jgi:E3 ubiquitin-protein ligase CCNP1IP1
MEHILRCNTLKCRTDLNDHAVVTTCRYNVLLCQLVVLLLLMIFSHVFCIDCANHLQLSDPPAGQRPVCPACDAHLTNPDDAVITNLNPTEDYKTSVLSGLSPNVIMECAGRALSFWAYQITQEVYVHRLISY